MTRIRLCVVTFYKLEKCTSKSCCHDSHLEVPFSAQNGIIFGCVVEIFTARNSLYFFNCKRLSTIFIYSQFATFQDF